MITLDELKSNLHYDPETGVFKWLIKKKGRNTNRNVGCILRCDKSYLVARINYKLFLLHRLAWLYMTGNFPENEIDHINGNGLDNRWCNLRNVTSLDNRKNMRKPSNNSSGVIGVSWHRLSGKWRALINVNYSRKHLGLFNTVEEARVARIKAEIEYGFHENHGSNRPL